MADQKPTENSYKLLGGVNTKASLYEMSMAQCLALYNMDFDVPNAWQKRPGQTYAITSSNGTSGPISSLFEFIKLSGASYQVLGSDTAMFYVTSNALTLLSSGWNNGQPTDMLTFTDRLWMANGQNWKWWDGATVYPVGLPIPAMFSVTLGGGGVVADNLFNWHSGNSSASYMLVLGATHILRDLGGTSIARGIYFAYSYLRNDGYQGPGNFLVQARNVVTNSTGVATGGEATGSANAYSINGFTIPTGYGITAVNLWFALDTIYSHATANSEVIPGIGLVNTGDLGWMVTNTKSFCSVSLKPNADITKFRFFTAIPSASLFLSTDGNATFWSATNIIFGSTFATMDGPPVNGFSGMIGDFFTSFMPKYIDINQNTMFISGFSSSPSKVKFSEVGEPEFFNPDNTFEVRTNDGDVVTGIKSFNNQEIITKVNSFHKVVGDSADNYQLVQVSDQYGCLSKRTIIFRDQIAYWLDKKGILEFNGANHQILSGPIEGIFRRMNIAAAKEKACGVHHIYRNQLWWGIPLDSSTTNNFTVVYDYFVGAWTFFDGFNPASFAYIKGALTKPTVWRGDFSGMIHYFGSSFYSDSSQAITCMALTRFDLAKENETWIWRRFFLDVATATGITGVINGQVFSNYDQSTVQATFAIYQNQFQSRAEMGVVGKAAAAKFSHSSASLPLLINGYSWAKRGLRNV